jgi:hypothetical protein
MFWKVEKRIADFFESPLVALVLADFMGKEAVLKKSRQLLSGGWFYYNVVDIEKNLFIGRALRRKIVKRLEAAKLIKLKKEESTFLNRTHYKINHAAVIAITEGSLMTPRGVNDSPASEVTNAPASAVTNDLTYKEIIIRNNNKNITPIVPTQIVDLWNEVISFKRAMGLTPKRKKLIEALLKDFPDLAKWREVFLIVENSTFLSGKTKQPWRGCNLDWVVNPNNWIKVLEGNYSDDKKESNKSAALKLISNLGGKDNGNF